MGAARCIRWTVRCDRAKARRQVSRQSRERTCWVRRRLAGLTRMERRLLAGGPPASRRHSRAPWTWFGMTHSPRHKEAQLARDDRRNVGVAKPTRDRDRDARRGFDVETRSHNGSFMSMYRRERVVA